MVAKHIPQERDEFYYYMDQIADNVCMHIDAQIAKPVGNTSVTCWSVGAKAVTRSEPTMVSGSSRTMSVL